LIGRGPGHRLTHSHPIGRPIARCGKTARVHKRLDQNRRIPVALGPVIHEPAQAPAQYVRSQIRHVHARRDQKPAITHHPVQIGTSSRLRPADVLIALLQTPLRSAESQGANPSVPRAFDQVANLCTAQRPFAQIVESLHKRIPYPRAATVAARDGNDADLAQFLQGAPNLRGINQSIAQRLWARALETRLLRCGQHNESAPMQFKKRLAAAHFLQSAVGRAPLQPFAHTQRQCASGQRRLDPQALFDLGDGRCSEFATTQLHVACITLPAHSVKRVPKPEQSWGFTFD